MKFSKIAKYLREEANLSQVELSKKLGISSGAVGHLETGRNEPTASTLLAYAKYFNVSIDELLDNNITPTEKAAGAAATRKESITPIEDELLYTFRQVGKKHGEETQKAIITMIEKML